MRLQRTPAPYGTNTPCVAAGLQAPIHFSGIFETPCICAPVPREALQLRVQTTRYAAR